MKIIVECDNFSIKIPSHADSNYSNRHSISRNISCLAEVGPWTWFFDVADNRNTNCSGGRQVLIA
jgi:hypothetical protein